MSIRYLKQATRTAASQDDSTRVRVAGINGIMVLSETIHNKLTQNFLKARLVIPLRPKRREPGSQLPANHTGWTRVDRLYDYTHRETFSAQSNDTS